MIPEPYSESDTRQQLIDQRLRLAGWILDDPTQVIQELDIYLENGKRGAVREPRTAYTGHQFVDYGLVLRGKTLAVIEAKKTSHYPPSPVTGFPTREDLEWMAERQGSKGPLSVELIATAIAGRDYQIEGIRALLEAIEAVHPDIASAVVSVVHSAMVHEPAVPAPDPTRQ